MRNLVSILCGILALTAYSVELRSPYRFEFFEPPSWLPYSVTAGKTPGSDSSFEIITHTNLNVTAWELADDSKVAWYLGTDPYLGNLPQWNTDQWSPVSSIFDTQGKTYNTFYLSVTGGREESEAVDEWGEDLHYYLTGYIVDSETGATLAEDNCTAHYVRDVDVEVTSSTNLVCRRLTEEQTASFFKTLEGWAEREYFTGLGTHEPNHTLATAPMESVPTNRAIATRRFVGKTNLWNVASSLVDISQGYWRAGFSVPPSWTAPTPYSHHVFPYWSSRVFDTIYGTQLPGDIDWNTSGLYSLSNKCAVLRGLKPGTVWDGNHDDGWFYTEMFPEDFLFGCDAYDTPATPPGHDFDFPTLCSTNFPFECVDEITNRSLRLELKTQAAANQAMAEMDRTVLSSGTISAGPGSDRLFHRTRMYSTDMASFEDIGLQAGAGGYYWTAPSDIGFSFHETTNSWFFTNHVWSTDASNCDAIEVTKNNVTVRFFKHADFGSWEIPASEIVSYLNTNSIAGTTNRYYYVYNRSTANHGGTVEVQLGSDIGCSLPVFHFPAVPTNTMVGASVEIGNSYDLKVAGLPAYEDLDLLPMDQAWESGSHQRVRSCRDVCTAAIMEDDNGSTNLNFHCRVMTRDSSMPVQNVHSNEWILHRAIMESNVSSARPLNWLDLKSYVEFTYGHVLNLLSSVKIKRGAYITDWETAGSSTITLTCDAAGVWHCADTSQAAIIIAPFAIGFDWDIDTSDHAIPTRRPIKEHCRQRITNVVDWNFNAIRKNQ